MRDEEREPSGWRVSDGRPEPAQLAAVMQPIVETVDPEMVIVFGSAARATMTAESDVDLVVVKDVSDLEAMKARAAVCLPTGHPPVHIVPATRRLLNDLRDSPSWVYGPAMAEGIVAYERGGGARGWSTRAWDRIAIPESPGERMVRILYYQREEAMDWLRKAEHDMQVVRSRDTTIGLQVRCYSAQAAAEKAIKALLVAHGQPVRAEHELHKLAEELEKTGEKLPATATRERLELLAKFGGEAQYPRWQDPTSDAEKTHFCQMATEIYDRARARAPEVLDTRARQELSTSGDRATDKGVDIPE
jgi:HEPN domain-containing protein